MKLRLNLLLTLPIICAFIVFSAVSAHLDELDLSNFDINEYDYGITELKCI